MSFRKAGLSRGAIHEVPLPESLQNPRSEPFEDGRKERAIGVLLGWFG